MKPAIPFIIALALGIPACAQAQSRSTRTETTKQERSYRRQTQKHQIKTADSSDLNAILKDSANAETGPILNDNGNVNSTGAVDGSRSATGRPDADTSYTVRRKKTVIRSGYDAPRDTTRRGKRP